MNVTPNEALVNSREQRRYLAVHPWHRNAHRATMESCYQHADDARDRAPDCRRALESGDRWAAWHQPIHRPRSRRADLRPVEGRVSVAGRARSVYPRARATQNPVHACLTAP